MSRKKEKDEPYVYEYLKSICRKCKKANGKCIKNDVYVGLCVENDKKELLELYEREKRY